MLPCKEPESSPTTKKHTATHTRYKPDLNLNGSENIKTNVQLARLNLLFYFEGFIAFNQLATEFKQPFWRPVGMENPNPRTGSSKFICRNG